MQRILHREPDTVEPKHNLIFSVHYIFDHRDTNDTHCQRTSSRNCVQMSDSMRPVRLATMKLRCRGHQYINTVDMLLLVMQR